MHKFEYLSNYCLFEILIKYIISIKIKIHYSDIYNIYLEIYS